MGCPEQVLYQNNEENIPSALNNHQAKLRCFSGPFDRRAGTNKFCITIMKKTSRRLVSIIKPSGRTSHGKSARPGGRGAGGCNGWRRGEGLEPTKAPGP